MAGSQRRLMPIEAANNAQYKIGESQRAMCKHKKKHKK